MIYLDYANLEKLSKNYKLREADLEKNLHKIHSRNRGFYRVVQDKDLLESIMEFSKENAKKFKHFVILGIGGSALGAATLKEALSPETNLHIIDNIDPDFILQTEKKIDLKKTLFLTISKSGSTIETTTLFLYFSDKCKKAKLSLKKHFVFITNSQEGFLHEISQKEKIPTFPVPENISGRFSVFSAVGLLPAALMGIKIDKLISGAKKAVKNFEDNRIEKNIAFKMACTQKHFYDQDKTINVLMPYCQRLEKLTEWYKQLLSESIGKENKGITPVNALGVTDQHSQIQLYNEGQKDKLVIFIEVKKTAEKLEIPKLPKELRKTSFNQLFKLEKDATAEAMTHYKGPNLTIKIGKIDEASLGELMMFFMCSVAFLGELFEINAFDQPGVEMAKKIIKKKLINN